MEAPRPSMSDPLVENDGNTLSVSIYPPNGYVIDEIHEEEDSTMIYYKRED